MKYKLDEVTKQELPNNKRYKVCVYTICKNEAKHIPRWMQCIQDADLVYILDTGSIDNSVSLFKQYPKVRIDTFLQADFDFSVARNESYKNAKKYCTGNINDWIFVTLDLDEFLEPAGIQKIKYYWNDRLDTHLLFEDLDGLVSPRVHKVHSPGNWIWENKVHEVPKLNGISQAQLRVGNYCSITYNHEQDLNKIRPYYEMLQECEEKQSDLRNLCNMMWESHDSKRLDDSIDVSVKFLNKVFHEMDDSEYRNDATITSVYLNKAFCEYELFDYDAAVDTLNELYKWYFPKGKCLSRSEQGLRATILYKKQEYRSCIRVLLKLLNTKAYWQPLADVTPWDDVSAIYMLLAQAYSELRDYSNAQLYAKLATEYYEKNINRVRT